ncbi:ALP1-like protein isoform X1 [Tanacetum coccineum]
MASRHGNSSKILSVNHTAADAIGFRVVATSQRAMSNQEAGGSGSDIKRTRAYIPREREEAEQRLLNDYFGDDETPSKYPKEKSRRRKGYDATSRASIDPILKCTSAIRQLAYGTSADAFDEYLQIAERCSRECLDNFTKCIYILYVEEYLRRPSLEDIEKTYALHEEKHGLPGMLGSIDCMHWDWKNCPKALHGQFKRKDHKYPTLMLEAVADQKLWIWHAYFGVSGANNDLNVLYGSPLFDDVLSDTAPEAPFVVNGRTYKKGYYLADGIYPTWSSFVKTFSIARDEKTLRFKRVQESARKDIERAFGVLQDGTTIVETSTWYILVGVETPRGGTNKSGTSKIIRFGVLTWKGLLNQRDDVDRISTLSMLQILDHVSAMEFFLADERIVNKSLYCLELVVLDSMRIFARFLRPTQCKNIREGNKKPNVTPTPSVKPNLSGSLESKFRPECDFSEDDYVDNVGQVWDFKREGSHSKFGENSLVTHGGKEVLQETKMKKQIEDLCVGNSVGNLVFDYVYSEEVGISGGKWRLTGKNMMIIGVYAPQEGKEKQALWDFLRFEVDKWNGDVIIMGDFNEVRVKSDRFGTHFNPHGLSATKMSKLDRFLVSESVISGSPNIKAVTLERFLSDHRPILLKENGACGKGFNLLLFHEKKLGNGLSTYSGMTTSWRRAGITQVGELAKVINPLVVHTHFLIHWSWTLNNCGAGYTVTSSDN